MIPILQDHFKAESLNGVHECYVTSPARISVANSIEMRSFFSVEVARSLVAQLIHAVAYIHSRGIVHGGETTDPSLHMPEFYRHYGEPISERLERYDEGPLTPGVPTHITEPIWLRKIAHKFTVPEARLLLSDFGEASHSTIKKEPKLGKDCKSPRYCLPPKAYFEPGKPLSFTTDIWTVACAIWNITTGYQLFSCFFPDSDEVTAQHIQILGALPPEKMGNGKFHPSESFSSREWRKRRNYTLVEINEEATALLDMLESMLTYRPELRASISTFLNSDWMVYWGSPSYEVRHHKVDSWLPLSTAVS
ncbi:protein kinase-like protein [Penicillium herquei]|nr:protein kinase-like protein [Penicillium herquei]